MTSQPALIFYFRPSPPAEYFLLEAGTFGREGTGEPPLVVDLDGTLVKSDMLVESFFALMASRPVRALGAVRALMRGKAAFKQRIAADAAFDAKLLPVNEPLLDLIRAEKAKGRKIYLASAADRRHAEAVAAELGGFDGVFASDGRTNLAGPAKAEALCAAFGAGCFDYAGNGYVDFAVWEKARDVLVVTGSASMLRAVRRRFPHARQLGQPSQGLKPYTRALRLHQWLKNFLIFVPGLAAHQLGLATFGHLAVAFLSFSCAASSAYLLNDLLDLSHDREHPSKRHRPLASGAVPLASALAMIPSLLLAALALSLALPLRFTALLAGYYLVTVAYSLWIKRRMTADVMTLACLYGLRLVAGGAAVEVPLSPWLIAFATFFFLCLAIVKRCTELIGRSDSEAGDPGGRGYLLRDLPVLEAMAVASGYVAVMVFALYLNSVVVAELYRHPMRLWLICVVLLYWLSRVFVLMRRGEMHDDPVVFAATDRISLVCGAAVAAIVAASL